MKYFVKTADIFRGGSNYGSNSLGLFGTAYRDTRTTQATHKSKCLAQGQQLN